MRIVPHGAARLVVKLWIALDALAAPVPPLYRVADSRTAPVPRVPTESFCFIEVRKIRA